MKKRIQFSNGLLLCGWMFVTIACSQESHPEDKLPVGGNYVLATQGQFSVSDRDSNTPYIKNVRVVTNVVYYLKD